MMIDHHWSLGIAGGGCVSPREAHPGISMIADHGDVGMTNARSRDAREPAPRQRARKQAEGVVAATAARSSSCPGERRAPGQRENGRDNDDDNDNDNDNDHSVTVRS
jgi:hypothetical protein